ncbi:Na+/H+ antiporter NhaA [Leifsonia sp. NPDC058230]|uniref:Na+/H+ antiporter NhaA n=1 Tax=Leifsonia sp. NPDC058230 TaxID=3346391 RepID=UPI0036D785FD
MTDTTERTHTGRTVWSGSFAGQVSSFLRTESGSSGVLVAAIVAALIWANVPGGTYEAVWEAPLSFDFNGLPLTMDLREWVSSGLMTFFFLVVGLEARRELDLGSLRDRKQFLIPFAAGLTGMVIPVLIFLLINLGGPGAHGWGVAMSTDTALALGLLTLVGRHLPERVRGFLLTVFIVDDLVALLVIAVVYSTNIQFVPLVVAVLAFATIPIMHRWGRLPAVFFVIAGVVCWGALLFSGVDPVVAGLAIGLAAPAFSPRRENLQETSLRFRQFREQPTAGTGKSVVVAILSTTSPNERLQEILHPWTSFVIVPLFALANAGIHINADFLAAAFTSPITLGIVFGYVIGKPVAVLGASWLIAMITRGRVRPPVGWASVAGSGTIAGVGFTVAVLIAGLAFQGEQLDQAKVGVLAAALIASIITWLVFQVTATLPPAMRARAILGEPTELLDLARPVDPRRDHVRGPRNASVTVVEYGDFQCPYCGRAEPAVRELMEDADIRFVWRHLPISEVHPHAQQAAEASEAAASQSAFWELHDLMLTRQDHLRVTELTTYADELGLDSRRFQMELNSGVYASRVDEDIESADLSGASGTPTFFINGRRHYGAYDAASLQIAVAEARDVARGRSRSAGPETRKGREA